MAFAPATSAIEDAFAAIPGLTAYASDAPVFKSPTVVHADGTTLWARAFAGRHKQDATDTLLASRSTFYGGLMGGERHVMPDLRVGAFIGGGATRVSVAPNQGGIDSNLLFGGTFARWDDRRFFAHAGIQAGGSTNDSRRNINNNLAPGGIETATASYHGWYVSPEIKFGIRQWLGDWGGGAWTVTPNLRVRYLHGAFDGYTESGSTANLTVAARRVRDLEERGEIKLAHTRMVVPGVLWTGSISGGVLAVQRLGDTVGATLLGQAIPFAVPGDDRSTGLFAGAGSDWRSGSFSVFIAGDYLALSDDSKVWSGRGGLRMQF
jgi:outer membrane autotransporter protein